MIITKILDVKKNKELSIDLAIESINRGFPVAFPTETVYGLGAPIFNIDTIRKIFEIKQRDLGNPLTAHISNLNDVDFLCKDIPDDFYKLSEKFLPGPLAIILHKKNEINNIISGNQSTLSIRFPANSFFLEFANIIGQPFAATSANLSGRPSPNCAEVVLDDLNGKIEYILDTGKCDYSIESTVISLVGENPILVRPGVISKDDIEKVIGKKLDIEVNSITLYNSNFSAIRNSCCKVINSEIVQDVNLYISFSTSKRILVLAPESLIDTIESNYKIILNIGTLFDSLRYAEKNYFDEVIVLFDKFVKDYEILNHRLKYSQKLTLDNNG